jgi:hypothetical protein
VIRCPPLGLVRCNYVAVAPLPKIYRHAQALLGLKCTIRCDAGNGQYLSIDEAESFVVRADEQQLVSGRDFDLPRASDIERIGAQQIERNFFPRRKGDYGFLFVDAHDRRGRGPKIDDDGLPQRKAYPG